MLRLWRSMTVSLARNTSEMAPTIHIMSYLLSLCLSLGARKQVVAIVRYPSMRVVTAVEMAAGQGELTTSENRPVSFTNPSPSAYPTRLPTTMATAVNSMSMRL